MTTTCPDDDVLRGLLDSSLPEPVQREVVAHLDDCDSCQSKLEQIAEDGSAVLQVARSANEAETPRGDSAFWPALKKVESEIEAQSQALTVTRIAPALESDTDRQRAFPFLDPSDDPEHLGQIDRFKIVELVGRGGMGMVFRAFDACLQRTVAVKLLDPQYAKNELARSRFIREARAAAGVSHENVVTIHHVECVEEKDLSFIVMQFVRGRSLQDRLDEGGPLPIREAVRIATAAAAGLSAAHANNLIHRDIKPGNILLEQTTGRVLLTDFGLARLTEDVKLTQTGFVAGTPLYMSPEQARGETVDHRSDLFSLGSVLYAMLAGSPPFPGTSPFNVLKHVTDTRPRPVQDHNPAVSHSLADVVERLLEKDPRNRYADAAEAAVALNAELAKLPADPVIPAPTRRTTRLTPRYLKSWWRRNSPIALAAVCFVVVALAITELTGLTNWTILGQRGSDRSVAQAGGSETTPPIEGDTPTRYTLPPGEGAVWAVAFDPCAELIATATEGGVVQFWDVNEGHIRGVLANQKYKSPIWAIAFSKDGQRLVTASDDGYVRQWDVKSKQEAGFSFNHTFPVRSVALSPDGTKLVSGTRNGAVIIWDIETGKEIHMTNGHEGGTVNAVAFSPDGKLVASAGSDKTVKLWDVENGSPRATLTNHTGPVYAIVFDPTSQILASAGWDRTIRLWDTNTSLQTKVLDVHKEEIYSLAFCPLGKHVLVGGQNGLVRWLDIESGEIKRTYRTSGGTIHSVAVSKDGALIAAGGRDGAVRVWDVER
jgi:WD40 repeat protein/serine/threonine protein kinase